MSHTMRLALAALVVIGITAAGYIGQHDPTPAQSIQPANQVMNTSGAHTYTLVSRESAEGASGTAITTQTLPQIEARSLEMFRTSMAKELEARGKRMPPNDIRAESVIFDSGPQRLAVTRFKAKRVELAAQFLGIVDGDLIRVMCFTNTPGGLVLARGPCADKIRQVFGVSLDPSH